MNKCSYKRLLILQRTTLRKGYILGVISYKYFKLPGQSYKQ